MNVAVDRRRTMPALSTHPGMVCAVLASALLLGAAPTQAQNTTQPPAATASKKAAAPAKEAGAGDVSSKGSYSIGVSFGAQLRAAGLSPDNLSVDRLAQGVRDALGGKVQMSEADRENIQSIVGAAQANLVEKNHKAAASFLAENAKKKDVVTTTSGLQYKVIAEGTGNPPKPSDDVLVNYKGSLLDGTVFDASEKAGGPASLTVGRLIPGFTEALLLMKPGAKYQLFIPPKLAYDEHSPSPVIPPGSMLVFDLELVSIKPHAAPPSGAAPHPAPALPPASK